MRLEGRVNGVGNYFVSILVHAMVRTLPPSLSLPIRPRGSSMDCLGLPVWYTWKKNGDCEYVCMGQFAGFGKRLANFQR